MRLAVLCLLFLAGCQQDFDDQYAEAEEQLQNDARRLDSEMAREAAREPGAEE